MTTTEDEDGANQGRRLRTRKKYFSDREDDSSPDSRVGEFLTKYLWVNSSERSKSYSRIYRDSMRKYI